MSRLRWRKIARDVWSVRLRVLGMVAAIALSVTLVAAFLTAQSILRREISDNYLAGNPASATLHVPGGVTQKDVVVAKDQPGVMDAIARDQVLARVRVGDGGWQPLLLFVSAPDDPRRLSSVSVEDGIWPPDPRGVFLERTALPYLGVRLGDPIEVRVPGGATMTMTVAGSVHDPGVAPAAQERTAYAQVTTSALELLGRSSTLTELKIAVGDTAGPSGDPAAVEPVAQRVASALGGRVTAIDVPPPLRHPHYGQMTTVGTVLLAFGFVALLLSSVLVATMLGGMVAGQVRQIGAMKAIGARTGQVLGMYLTMVAAIALVATAVAVYPGVLLGRAMAGAAGDLLNLDVSSSSVPGWVLAIVLVAGLGVPVLVSLPPLVRGSRRTVRDAIDDHGSNPAGRVGRLGARLGRLPGLGRTEAMAIRGLARRPVRLVLAVGLLTVAGVAFMTGLNSARAWTQLVQTGVDNRHYDVEVRLAADAPPDGVADVVRAVPGVRDAEAWARIPVSIAVDGRIDTSHVYPDDGHGSFMLMAPPPGTSLITLPMRAGRWLRPGDSDAIVLNTAAITQQAPGTTVGDTIALSVEGRTTRWHVVGIASDFGTQGAAYVAQATAPTTAARMVRAVTDAQDPPARRAILASVEQALDDANFQVEQGLTTDDLHSALDGHVFVLIEALVAISLLIAATALLGLASAQSTSVTERTREFAIMQVLGATDRAVRGLVVTEGVLVGLAGLVVAIAISVPVSAAFAAFFGRSAFGQALPLSIAPAAVLLWTVLTLLGSGLASAGAARRASRLTIRDALAVV
ncbi:FtsX-like permease family protein [Cellulomonas sp. URHD0024]|uniref:FtsX-like permease family protein n=1 Tax=Cellulomonas sp. URHD0024 TaxID=1302620 RepID=UPI000429100C|nr:FtsX-like permease family protein [Cellulomonas sp. URHD0024]